MIIAWDPGNSGGFAVKEGGVIHVVPMHDDESMLIGFLKSLHDRGHRTVWYESQTYCTGVRVSAFTMGRFGEGLGFCRGVMAAIGFNIIPVTPQAWQKHLGIQKGEKMKKNKGMTQAERDAVDAHNAPLKVKWKNDLKEAAIKFFGGKLTLKTADAVLVLKYAIEKEIANGTKR